MSDSKQEKQPAQQQQQQQKGAPVTKPASAESIVENYSRKDGKEKR